MKRVLERSARLGAIAGLMLTSALTATSGRAEPPTRWTIVHAGTLMQDPSRPVEHDVSLVVHDGMIDSIRAGFVGPAALPGVPAETVQIVELRDKFVMAGFVDAHVHTNLPEPDFVNALENVRTMVSTGATTVRDAGSVPETISPLRDAIAKGLVIGPRIMASGAPITTTGGHGDFRNGDQFAVLRPPALSSGVCDGVEECRKVTRRQIQLGADQIKIIITGGISDNADTGLDQQFSDEELHAIVETAHLMKRKVMAHAIGIGGIKAGLRAGVDSIEHGMFLDQEAAATMARQGTYLVPTLQFPRFMLESFARSTGDNQYVNATIRAKFARIPDAQPGGGGLRIKLAMKNGVKIAAGTDELIYPITEEVIMFSTIGGMTPMQALAAGTVNGADLLGLSAEVGTLDVGKSADVIAFDGDPMHTITDLRKLRFVMARGNVVVAPGFTLR